MTLAEDQNMIQAPCVTWDRTIAASRLASVLRRSGALHVAKNLVERINLSFPESPDRTKRNVQGAADAAALRQDVEPPMALTLRKDNALATGIDESSPREQVLVRYRQLREISKRHHHKILDCISADAFLHQARRLGLVRGKTLILEDMDELNYVHDLVIHTAPAGRSRAIDRYARSAHLVARSDEALVLEAMRVARFAILVIERRHEAAGLIATDLFRRDQVWLVDIGLEESMPEGAMMATRLYTPERFSMTAGVNVPFDLGLIEDLYAELPRHLGQLELTTLIDDRRFAETIYRVALADGIMDRVAYQELPRNP
jgi:hypothetical protein